ncbi:Uncharacterised protein [Klebsiella pneumoniae]|nr:hypothetical protein AD97_05134 [Klebsiella pneumoniae MGH 71]PBA93501.1 hypothetical protein CK495_28985 [Klebsiella pneumoniae]QFY25988.1 hypothetical protein C2D62_30185 [Klebsiella variicola]RLK70753.1 hypothetical protein D9K85_23175 [Klebsiella pneumoniae]SAX84894.1 Uncharacterised protein [Klebsiella variicola]
MQLINHRFTIWNSIFFTTHINYYYIFKKIYIAFCSIYEQIVIIYFNYFSLVFLQYYLFIYSTMINRVSF